MTVAPAFIAGGSPDGNRPWRVLAGGERTGGAVTFGDARIPPNSAGPGRHVHTREDEAIYVVEGVLTVEVGDQRFEAGPETLVWLPRNMPHVFANLSKGLVRTVGVITPSGLEGMFAEQADYFSQLQGPPDPEVLTAISLKYGVQPVDGPPLT
jgi:mannose-6-phosphate isomerase-like protein (cupin superfamily)